MTRNDKVVMAANGFAADAKTLVKRVQQRLEVCSRLPLRNSNQVALPSQSRQGCQHWCYRQVEPANALWQTLLPILCICYIGRSG